MIPLAGSAGIRALPGVVGNDRSLKPGIRFPRGRGRTPDRESQVRRRLAAGGKGVRTLGPPYEEGRFSSLRRSTPTFPWPREGPRVRIRLPPAASLQTLGPSREEQFEPLR